MSKQFVRISGEFGFNRNRLLFWDFAGDSVELTFEGEIDITLEGADARTFRNWTETEAEPAPETHQYSMFGRPQDTREPGDLKEKSTPGGGK